MEPFGHRSRGTQTLRPSWHGTAFIVEAIILLAFLVGSVALFMQLFSDASLKGVENDTLAHAIVLASNSAEQFSADPENVSRETKVDDGFGVTCSVTPEKSDGGTLYRADIVVSKDGEDIYSLSTARYVSEVTR